MKSRLRALSALIVVVALLGALAAGSLAAAPWGPKVHDPEFCKPEEVGTNGVGIRLRLEHYAVPQGQPAFVRVENHGAEAVEFGVDYRVQRFADGAWERAPGGPGNVFPQIAVTLESGRSGFCMRYFVPRQAESGRYRFFKPITSPQGSARNYVAEFTVLNDPKTTRPS